MRSFAGIAVFMIFIAMQLRGQISTFNQGLEGWTITGDAQNGGGLPDFRPIGGNPDGHLTATDDNQGGTWYWVAPPNFLGNKCSAYGANLSFDLKQDQTDSQSNNVDIYLSGGGINLTYNTAANPGLDWTRYSVELKEGKWRLNTLNGAICTQQDMKKVLANVTRLWIRGEYASGPTDMGGIDNVVLPVFIEFDLDANDNSGALQKDYRSNKLCYTGGVSAIADSDLVVSSMLPIDSILIENSTKDNLGKFIWVALDTSQIQIMVSGEALLLKNKGSARDSDFSKLIQKISFVLFESLLGNDVFIDYRVFAGACGPYSNIRTTIPVHNARYIGLNTDTVLCDYSSPVNLGNLAKINPTLAGSWTPSTNSKNDIYQPGIEHYNRFVYKIPALWGCKADSIFLKINLVKRADSILPNLKYLCKEQRLDLRPLRAYATYLWSTGETTSGIKVVDSGVYAVTVSDQNCAYADTVDLSLVTCTACQFYVPNIFTPNQDGKNDDFGVFGSCIPDSYSLQVFSRWGERVFSTGDFSQHWDGTFKGRKMDDGVFVYHWSATYEYYGEVYYVERQGDVALIAWEQN